MASVCLKFRLLGFNPEAIAVAIAIAKTPQSLPPFLLATLCHFDIQLQIITPKQFFNKLKGIFV